VVVQYPPRGPSTFWCLCLFFCRHTRDRHGTPFTRIHRRPHPRYPALSSFTVGSPKHKLKYKLKSRYKPAIRVHHCIDPAELGLKLPSGQIQGHLNTCLLRFLPPIPSSRYAPYFQHPHTHHLESEQIVVARGGRDSFSILRLGRRIVGLRSSVKLSQLSLSWPLPTPPLPPLPPTLRLEKQLRCQKRNTNVNSAIALLAEVNTAAGMNGRVSQE
jgi:hypothetical protein